mmetsp:Transcript_1605/g.2184  ORF Transcript_1605/g.2184 Transcript_1605/m.2184 type:complete len:103 (+) Transcript_1605:65-373(+)
MDALDITEQPYAFYTEDQYQYHFAFVSLYTFFGVPLFGWSIAAIGAAFAGMITSQDAEIALHSGEAVRISDAHRWDVSTRGGNSSSEPLLEGLFAQIHIDLS